MKAKPRNSAFVWQAVCSRSFLSKQRPEKVLCGEFLANVWREGRREGKHNAPGL